MKGCRRVTPEMPMIDAFAATFSAVPNRITCGQRAEAMSAVRIPAGFQTRSHNAHSATPDGHAGELPCTFQC